MARDEFAESPFAKAIAAKDGRVLQAVYRAVDEVNLQLPRERWIEKSPGTALLGESTRVDSLALISLIAAVEEEIDRTFHMTIDLIDGDDLGSTQTSPIRTIGSLVQHACERLNR